MKTKTYQGKMNKQKGKDWTWGTVVCVLVAYALLWEIYFQLMGW